jgi:hypothetical protein
MLAITNTPLDLPIEFANSGRAIYRPHVMQCYLPSDIEPFYSEPQLFDPNDDWHWNATDPKCKFDPKDEFVHWRRWYMDWHTDEEKRQDAEKRMESQRASERLIAALDELKKKNKQKQILKNNFKKHTKSRILKRQFTASSQCTASSSHSWIPSDDASSSQSTASSSHSWMHSDDASSSQNTTSSSHSWMHSDLADEATAPSLHSWMHSDVEVLDEATPSSPHSWMHGESE